MCHSEETDNGSDCDFKWGKMKTVGGKNKAVIFYESCTYDGVEYFLYDCVYLYGKDEPVPYIGKLVKMWEVDQKRRMKVVWFFRPIEIKSYLWNTPPEKEIFLASGEGKGASNVNPLEVLVGKCNVVCTSKDRRNPQPSEEQVNSADYIFYRVFDVEKLLITDKFEDEIVDIEIQYFLNKKRARELSVAPKLEGNLNKKRKRSDRPYKLISGEAVHSVAKNSNPTSAGAEQKKKKALLVNEEKQFPVENTISRPQDAFHMGIVKADKEISSQAENKPMLNSFKGKSYGSPVRKSDHKAHGGPAKDFGADDRAFPKKVLGSENDVELYNKLDSSSARDNGVKAKDQVMEGPRRPAVDTSNWFKNLTWEERLQNAYSKETVVLFQNLDASYSSSEVEDIINHIFEEKCTVKLITQVAFPSPHNGQALAIFKSKEVAGKVINKLNNRYLMMENARPLLAFKATPPVPETSTKFVGHLTIDHMNLQKQRVEMRNAVSTSHFPQPNTLEYDMAVEWCLLEKRSELWWEAQHEEQGKELDVLQNQLTQIKSDLESSAYKEQGKELNALRNQLPDQGTSVSMDQEMEVDALRNQLTESKPDQGTSAYLEQGREFNAFISQLMQFEPDLKTAAYMEHSREDQRGVFVDYIQGGF